MPRKRIDALQLARENVRQERDELRKVANTYYDLAVKNYKQKKYSQAVMQL